MTDLTDAALRELARRKCIYAFGNPDHPTCPRCEWQAKGYIALRDAARAEQRDADAKALEILAIKMCCCGAEFRGPIHEAQWHSDACDAFHALYEAAAAIRSQR